jgi:hypothetical protein
MQKNNTSFDINKNHIHLDFFIQDLNGVKHSVTGILDTGAPRTEFSDDFLIHTGLIDTKNDRVSLKKGLQTQKYGMIEIPLATICNHQIISFEVFVSHFESSWGVDALIGLDFFRLFSVTIDYKKGNIITFPY